MVYTDGKTSQSVTDLHARALKTVRAAGYRVRVPGNEPDTFYVAARP
jgi:hypothetical protein